MDGDNKDRNYRDGSLLKKKQDEWAQDDECSDSWFPFGNTGSGSTNRHHRSDDLSASDNKPNETRGEADISWLRKKLESDINKLEKALGRGNQADSDAQKILSKYQDQIHELQQQVVHEQHNRENIREQYLSMKSRATALKSEKDELVVTMERAIRSGRQAGRDANDSTSHCDGLTKEAHSLNAIDRQLDAELNEIQSYLNQTLNELNHSEERSKAATTHAARLIEQVHQEQQSVIQRERKRKPLEVQLKEVQARLDEAEAAALKGDKQVIATFESRIRELENELDDDQRRYNDANKALSEHDSRVQQLRFQVEEDKKNAKRAHDLIDKLQHKLNAQEKLIEEAKLRHMQHQVDDAADRAGHA